MCVAKIVKDRATRAAAYAGGDRRRIQGTAGAAGQPQGLQDGAADSATDDAGERVTGRPQALVFHSGACNVPANGTTYQADQ
jgi:hypothetical protein